jgi:hypothetical protein
VAVPLTVTAALLLTGGLAMVLGTVACSAISDAVGWSPDVDTAARVREHRGAFVAYIVLVIAVPRAVALYFRLLFISLLLEQ